MLALLAACSGGGTHSGVSAMTLPPFTRYSTDLAATPTQGTIGNPLKVAPLPRCPFLPFVSWQGALCTTAPPDVWTFSNGLASTLDPDRWRVVVNVEPAWDTNCNTGPPAQSLAMDRAPINVILKSAFATIGFELANEDAMCQKIPYVALTYIRGVQGDSTPRLSAWGQKPILTFDGTLTRTIGPTFAQSVHFWVHVRDKGVRYMAHTHLWQSGYEPPDFRLNWNWPVVDSYYYPGAWIHGGDTSRCPGSVIQAGDRWTVDLEALALCRFPDFAATKPDILGFEIAVEGAYLDYAHKTNLPNRVAFTLANMTLTSQ